MKALFTLTMTLLVGLFLGPGPASASDITLTYYTPCGPQSATTTSGSVSNSYAQAIGGCTPGSDMSVQSDATLTSANLSLSAQNPNSLGLAALTAWTVINDTLTITGGTGSGTLIMDISLNGTLTANNYYSSLFLIDTPYLSVGPVGEWWACGANSRVGFPDPCPAGWGTSTSVQTTLTLLIPFTYGVAFNTSVQFQGGASPTDYSFLGPKPGGGTVNMSARISYTVQQPVSVPEPSSLSFLVTGGLGLFAARRRKAGEPRV